MLAAAVVFLPGCLVGSPRPSSPAAPRAEPSREDDAATLAGLVSAHNRERARSALPALTVDPRLEAAARRHAADMASRRRMSHKGGDRSSPFQRMQAEGYRYGRAAENVAAGSFTLETLMSGWMKSPPHRRNVLGPYSHIGASVASDERGISYWCVTFGEPFHP